MADNFPVKSMSHTKLQAGRKYVRSNFSQCEGTERPLYLTKVTCGQLTPGTIFGDTVRVTPLSQASNWFSQTQSPPQMCLNSGVSQYIRSHLVFARRKKPSTTVGTLRRWWFGWTVINWWVKLFYCVKWKQIILTAKIHRQLEGCQTGPDKVSYSKDTPEDS